jgi:hypothetical protein
VSHKHRTYFDCAAYCRELASLDDAALFAESVRRAVAYLYYKWRTGGAVVMQLREQVKATEAECKRRGVDYDAVVEAARKRRREETQP